MDAEDPDELPIYKEWRELVATILDSQGHGARRRLAHKLKIEPSYVTKLLQGKIDTSPYVRQINKELGISQLDPVVVDSRVLKILRKLHGASEQVLRAVQSVVDLPVKEEREPSTDSAANDETE